MTGGEKKAYMKKYHLEHKEIINKRNAQYYKDNTEKCKSDSKRRIKERKESWNSFFNDYTTCQICGTSVSYNSGNAITSIHFDHRNNGDAIIKGCPSHWLASNNRTPESEKVFKSCNFGILCLNCNRILPTINRREYVKNLLNYINK